MHALLAAFFFLAQPFWETKSPQQWTDLDIDAIRHDSPWVQTVGPDPVLLVWLATAQPILQAEAEARLRLHHPERELDPDYAQFLTESADQDLVLAIAYPNLRGLGDAAEQHRLEEESEMIVGRQHYKIVGHFPPTPSDPVLRLVFPRHVKPADKSVKFQLYIEGVPFPEREVEFRVKDLMYRGQLSM